MLAIFGASLLVNKTNRKDILINQMQPRVPTPAALSSNISSQTS